MKRLMLLGGSRYLFPVIEAAHRLGCYVITCDYLPDNDAHKISDEYCNISVIDREAVLRAAAERKIDGILSFACDPGVVTAAYAAEKLGLPFQGSYRSVSILQDKGLFRKFLSEHGFNCPRAERYDSPSIPPEDLARFTWPLMIKPADSCGSKGVTRVDNPADLPEAIRKALSYSHSGAFIAEEFLAVDGYHSDTDPFVVDGRLRFFPFSDEMFDAAAENPYVPTGMIFPSTMPEQHRAALESELNRLMSLLDIRSGIFNIGACVSGGRPYIMEVSPRGGGCGIAVVQRMAFGVDCIENEVRCAVGLPLTELEPTECSGHWCIWNIHTRPGQSGILRSLTIDDAFSQKHIKQIDLTAKPGDRVGPFTGANMALGTVLLRFDSRSELVDALSRSNEWLHIDLI